MKPFSIPLKRPEGGENFFVLSIEIDTPDDPCWNDSVSIVGTWEVLTQAYVGVMELLAANGTTKVNCCLAQGEAAHRRLREIAKHEIRYEQQKKAQPNN